MGRTSTVKLAQLRRRGAEIGRDVSIHETAEILAKQIHIGDGVRVGPNTRILARELVLGENVRVGTGCVLRSTKITIGENSRLGDNNDIRADASLSIGKTSRIGNEADIRCRLISFGDEVFITNGLRVGGGGRNEPEAVFTVGHRCTMHNNFINVAKPVTVGNDVGFSPDTILITHGYWQSVLEGYSATFAPITIHDWVILGMRVIVLPGVEIGERTTVGAGAVVTRSLPARSVAVGVPARVIKTDYPPQPSDGEQDAIMVDLLHAYAEVIVDKGFRLSRITDLEGGVLLEVIKTNMQISISYFRGPRIPPQAFAGTQNVVLTFNAERGPPGTTVMNLQTLEIFGKLTPIVHDLRDFLRRRGIRFYGYGFFESLPSQVYLDLDHDLQK